MKSFFEFFLDHAEYEEILEKRFADLRDRLHYAESLNRQRENDLFILRNHFSYLLSSMHSNGSILLNRWECRVFTAFKWYLLLGGGGLNYFRAHIHRRFRHTHHETRNRQPILGSQGRGNIGWWDNLEFRYLLLHWGYLIYSIILFG